MSSASASSARVTDQEFNVGGTRFSLRACVNAPDNTFRKEFLMLFNSDLVSKWSEKLNLNFSTLVVSINSDESYLNNTYIPRNTDIGCRFSMREIREFLHGTASLVADETLTKHCWSLSNSSGKLIGPKDIKEYILTVFSDQTLAATGEDEARTEQTVGSFLCYCLTLSQNLQNNSKANEKLLYDSYVKYILMYFENSDLLFRKDEDNLLLYGILVDFCAVTNTYNSGFRKNVIAFNDFTRLCLPFISKIFEFRWLNTPPEPERLFELEIVDFLTPMSKVNFLTNTVIVGSKLKELNGYVGDDKLDSLKMKVEAILKFSNKEIKDTKILWESFYLYYGKHRTASERVEKRPAMGEFGVYFAELERFFDAHQRVDKSRNLRRVLNGYLCKEAFATFKKYSVGYPPISRIPIPEEYFYLHIDYFKQCRRLDLCDEEISLLTKISSDVDRMCSDRVINTNVNRKAQPTKHSFKSIETRFLSESSTSGSISRILSREAQGLHGNRFIPWRSHQRSSI